MAYKREGDRVTLTLTVEQFEKVLMALGMAAGLAAKEHGAGSRPFREWIRIADAVNEGNPYFRPYNLRPEDDPAPAVQGK